VYPSKVQSYSQTILEFGFDVICTRQQPITAEKGKQYLTLKNNHTPAQTLAVMCTWHPYKEMSQVNRLLI